MTQALLFVSLSLSLSLSSHSAEEQLRHFAVQNYEQAVSAALGLRVSEGLCGHGMAMTSHTAAPISLLFKTSLGGGGGVALPSLAGPEGAFAVKSAGRRRARGCEAGLGSAGLGPRLFKLRAEMSRAWCKTESMYIYIYIYIYMPLSQTAGLCLDALAQFGAVELLG